MYKYILFIIFIISIFYYIWLSINPITYDNGNKNDILEYIKEYTMKFETIDNTKEYDKNKIIYPKIFKPNICSGLSKNVEVIHNIDEAKKYHKKIKEKYIIQDISYYKNEVGLLYERLPFQKKGKIISIYKRRFENENKLNIWNITNKAKILPYIDKNNLITETLTDKIDNIIKKIPNMYACRLDIKYDNDIDFSKGIKFIILEVNGVMGFDLSFWDNSKNKILYGTRWIIMRLLIGILNIISFNGANIYNVFGKLYQRILTAKECNNWEKIFEYVYT
jgi:hypothetical protein